MPFLSHTSTSSTKILLGVSLSILLHGQLHSSCNQQALQSSNTSIPDTQECYVNQEHCLQNCSCGKECPCKEECACPSNENSRGCGCGKPRPKPRPKPRSSRINAMLEDVCNTDPNACVSPLVRNCYECTKNNDATPQDILHAMPDLISYALEYMKSPENTCKTPECYVETVVEYLEHYAHMLPENPAHKDVVRMLEYCSSELQNYPELSQRVRCIMNAISNKLCLEKNSCNNTGM